MPYNVYIWVIIKGSNKTDSSHSLWQRMWNDANISEMLQWFYNATGKRERPYNRWEPIYIGTNEVQPYHKFKIWKPTLAGDSHAFVWWDPWLAEVLFDTLCQEPTYDERLTWEGRSDKMVQVWKMLLKAIWQKNNSSADIVIFFQNWLHFKLSLICFEFRATRCVLLSTTTISWIMPFSYTGVQNRFHR